MIGRGSRKVCPLYRTWADGPAGPFSQLGVYAGTKRSRGNAFDRAGLTNGTNHVLDIVDESVATDAQFRAAFASGTAPVKARLLDQNALAGIGNLLADQALWLAKINPRRPVRELTRNDVNRLYRAVLASVAAAIGAGGVHTLSVLPFRKPGALCPRDGVPMVTAQVGGRTTWWCPREQT